MKNVVIAGYARSPFDFAKKGALAKVRPDELAAQVVQEIVKKSDLTIADVEDLIVGCAFPEAEQGLNIARMINFLCHFPPEIAGATINRFCGSSMQAIHMAAGAIRWDAGDLFICAGVESMTRVPMGGFNPLPHPSLYSSYPEALTDMGTTAENLAQKYAIPREKQEEFAVASHRKAEAARSAGNFAAEIVPIKHRDRTIDQDGCIRPDTTLQVLGTLKLAFDANGTVTAGTSSPLSDGAAAVIVASEEYAEEHGLPIRARIKSIAVAGCPPEIMGIGPVRATQKALARAGLSLDDIDIIEINEAFAPQVLACLQELGLEEDRINLDGGAIALGHPLGASGARITGKAADLLHREGKQFALATMCIGGGQGIATILEAV